MSNERFGLDSETIADLRGAILAHRLVLSAVMAEFGLAAKDGGAGVERLFCQFKEAASAADHEVEPQSDHAALLQSMTAAMHAELHGMLEVVREIMRRKSG